MDTKSIQSATMPWMQIPMTNPAMDNCCSMVAISASNRLIREEIPAKSTATKNAATRIRLPGMDLNRFGRKMNISPGPPWSSREPAAAMAGMITKAAKSAASVSNNATFQAAPITSSVSSR